MERYLNFLLASNEMPLIYLGENLASLFLLDVSIHGLYKEGIVSFTMCIGLKIESTVKIPFLELLTQGRFYF